MIILSWNIRGIGNSNTQNTLKNICFSHHPDIICLYEPMVQVDKIPPQFWYSIGMQLFATNDKNGSTPTIWILHSINSPSLTLISSSTQHITFTFPSTKGLLLCSVVYASNNYINRRNLWVDLATISANHPLPWSIFGDFNCVLGAHEKRGGCLPNARSCEDFQTWTDSCSLIHLNTIGPLFTWFKKGFPNMDSRLDRAICNQLWFDHWESVSCAALHRKDSDHTPLIFKSSHVELSGPKPFRFLSA